MRQYQSAIFIACAQHIAYIPMLHCKGNCSQGIITAYCLLPGAEALNKLIGCFKQSTLLQGYANEGVRCWTGNDDEAHEGRHSFGSQGVISVTSNLLPGLFSRLMRTPNQELSDSLQELIAWLFCEPNPIGINTAMVRAFDAQAGRHQGTAERETFLCLNCFAKIFGNALSMCRTLSTHRTR